VQREGRPGRLARLDADRAVVRLHDLLDDVEAEAEAARRAVLGDAAAERLEQRRDLVGRDRRAVVVHLQVDVCPLPSIETCTADPVAP
jgi:hypothetical protein